MLSVAFIVFLLVSVGFFVENSEGSQNVFVYLFSFSFGSAALRLLLDHIWPEGSKVIKTKSSALAMHLYL